MINSSHNRLLPVLSTCKYDAIVISDHAPVVTDINFQNAVGVQAPRRLNTRLLLLYSVMGTLKAGGEIISYTGYNKRQEKLTGLRQHISDINHLYFISPPELYKERLSLQMKFNSLTAHHTTELLLYARTAFNEHGDKARKASKLLAHQV